MGVRDSISRLKKKAKARLSWSGSEPEGSEVGGESLIGPMNPHPQSMPHIGVVEEGENIDPRVGESADNADNSVDLESRGGESHGKNQQDAMGGGTEDWKSTVASTAKLLLCTVRDSADVFPPLKSVAGGLCSILENCERAQGNKKAIQSLAPRVVSLAESLCAPVPEGDTGEGLRRRRLEQKLGGVREDLTILTKQGKVKGFLNNVGDAATLGGLLEDIRDAMMEYQTSLQQDIYDRSCRLIESADLTLLNGMHHITGAGYISGNRQGCLRGTRKDVLWQIECWLADGGDQRVFWLNGLAGTGKSTIAQTFAQTSFADGKLGASFFCSRDLEDRSNIQHIFPTLAFQLAYRYPEFRTALLPVLRANPEIGRDSLCSQLEKVIVGPLKATCISTLIIIDALDECKDEEPASAILSVLSRYVDQIPWVKFFITGRPEPRIRTGFRLELLRPITEVLKLHDVERSSVDADIKLFLEIQLTNIAKTRSDCDFMESWPNLSDIDALSEKSAGLFIYASTVVKFIASPHHLPTKRLTLIISLPQSTANEGKTGIDLLYTQVLEQAFHDADPDAQELYSHFKLVVGAVLLAFYPPSKKILSELLKKCDTPSDVSIALRSIHSLLLVPNNEVDPIRTFHKSFPDFLTDPGRCKDERFFVDPPAHHVDILCSCLDLMKERLRRNICDLDGSPLLGGVKDLPDRRETCIGGALEYACRFWTKHLSKIHSSGPHVKRVKAAIDDFFTTHLLFWIEVLGLLEHLNLGIYALHDIDQWYLTTGDSCEWTNDSQRLILSNFDRIRDSPTAIYHYILPFCPSSSWLHKWYTSESLYAVKVVKGRPDKWGACTRVVSFGHDSKALACWKDIIAVGLVSGDIVILDAVTGSSRSTLSWHRMGVKTLVFSMDGTLLVSGGEDFTITLWDIQTGGVVKTFRGLAHSVAISPDATTIASGSIGGVIALWDVRTGERHLIAAAPISDNVTYLDFLLTAPGRLLFVSGGLIRQWDIVNGSEAGPTTSGHHVAFSSDGKRFILCDKGHPTVCDTISGIIIATLHSPSRGFSRCCFSPNNEFVAGIADETIYIWNITGAPHLVETFVPHGGSISSIVYSSSLVSMHSDGKVRLWRTNGDCPDSTTRNPKSTGSRQTKIMYTTLQAEEGVAISASSAGIIELWDLSTGIPKFLLEIPKIQYVGGARLVNNILTIVCHHGNRLESDWNVSTWDVTTGEMLRREPLSGDLTILRFLEPGRYIVPDSSSGSDSDSDSDSCLPPVYSDIFSSPDPCPNPCPDPNPNLYPGISNDGTTFFVVDPHEIRTWSTLTGERTGSLTYRSRAYTPTFIFADLDGSIMWTRSFEEPQVQGWDLRDLVSPPLESSSMPDRLRLACLHARVKERANTSESRIIDAASKTEVFQLPGQFMYPNKPVWDGRYLSAVYETGELLILDFVHVAPR